MMRSPSMSPSYSTTNIFLQEPSLLFFVFLIQELGITSWAIFKNQFTFFFLDLLSCTIEHNCEINRVPLTCCSHSAKHFPKFFCSCPSVYISKVFQLSATEIICSSYVYKFSVNRYCVDDLDHFQKRKKIRRE